jgi:hypothetical protein
MLLAVLAQSLKTAVALALRFFEFGIQPLHEPGVFTLQCSQK